MKTKNQKLTEKRIAVMEAWINGGEIEEATWNVWNWSELPKWWWDDRDYRVATSRYFETGEECMAEGKRLGEKTVLGQYTWNKQANQYRTPIERKASEQDIWNHKQLTRELISKMKLA